MENRIEVILKEHKETLQKVNLFMNIEGNELIHVLTCLAPRISKFEKGEFVTMEGHDFIGIGIILDGKVKITQTNEAGERMILNQLSPGGVFGEMIAFSNNNKWLATVVADSNCTVMFLRSDAIINHCQRMCIGHKQLMLNMLTIVSNKALMMNRKVRYLSIKSMRGKLSKFLMEEYHRHNKKMFEIRYNRNELAEFLHVSRPSMSRELSRMKDEGIIDYYKESFKLLDIETLKDYASHLK